MTKRVRRSELDTLVAVESVTGRQPWRLEREALRAALAGMDDAVNVQRSDFHNEVWYECKLCGFRWYNNEKPLHREGCKKAAFDALCEDDR